MKALEEWKNGKMEWWNGGRLKATGNCQLPTLALCLMPYAFAFFLLAFAKNGNQNRKMKNLIS